MDDTEGAIEDETEKAAKELLDKYPTLDTYLDSLNFQDPLNIIYPNEAELATEQSLTAMSILSDPTFLERKINVRILEAFNLESYYKCTSFLLISLCLSIQDCVS